MGTMAIGSYLWGAIAQVIGTALTLGITAAALLLVAASVRIAPLHANTGRIDRSIDLAWPTPTLVFEPAPTDGPVTIILSYTVSAANLPAFEAAMKDVRDSRRRTGATRWRLLRSGEDASVVIETFSAPSWAEFRRQQTQRLTGRDREIRASARKLSDGEPVETHYFPALP